MGTCGYQATCGGRSAYLPIPIALHHAARGFEQTIRTVPEENLFDCTSFTLDIMTVFTPHEVVSGKEREVCTWGPRIKGFFFLFFGFLLAGRCCSQCLYWGRCISTRTADIAVRERHCCREEGGGVCLAEGTMAPRLILGMELEEHH